MAEMNTLMDALVDEVRDLYHAEKQLVKALPKMAKAATQRRAARSARVAPVRDREPGEPAGAGVRAARREAARQGVRRHGRDHRGRVPTR